ncbi:hypothetical protein HYC85_029202 [Camellia sinensis]|uniref:Uncharacterized protein n=1 Tax=Camellia sinensis TaxID=4442 RepID=A0A7J7FYJ1_CAMSI|nr:hypothetical protein HYC85_029202 [Camellia sinensis]
MRPIIIEQKFVPAYELIVAIDEVQDKNPWYYDIWNFLEKEACPPGENAKDKKAIRRMAAQFIVSEGKLYKRCHLGMHKLCIDAEESKRLMEAIHGEKVGLNPFNPPSTSGRGDISFEDIFTDLRDLPARILRTWLGSRSRNWPGEKCRKDGYSGRVETNRSEPPPVAVFESSLPVIVEKTAQIEMAETEQIEQLDQEAEIKNVSIASDASALKDPAVALSMASSISLPVDRATFRTEPNLLSIALAAQSAILMASKIAEIDRRQHDAIEQNGFLKAEIENEKSKAVEASQKADFESKKAKEMADSEISKAFQAGKDAALENYVEEVPKFENQDFKHGWLKALTTTNVTLAQPIPYEQVDVEPLDRGEGRTLAELDTEMNRGGEPTRTGSRTLREREKCHSPHHRIFIVNKSMTEANSIIRDLNVVVELARQIFQPEVQHYKIGMRLRAARRDIEQRVPRIQTLQARAQKAEKELEKANTSETHSASQMNSNVTERVNRQILDHTIVDREMTSMFAIESAKVRSYEKGFHDGRKIRIDKTKEKLDEEVCRCENREFKHGWIKTLQVASVDPTSPLYQSYTFPFEAFDAEKSDDEEGAE